MIELKHIKKEYENATPLKDVNTVINAGDVIAVIGPSGTGKSTLLRCINLLEKPTDGEIWVDGKKIDFNSAKDIYNLHRKIGMVFQSFNLFDNLTILENVMTPQIEAIGRTKQEAYDKAVALLKEVGLADKMFNYPDELSGGQKQRVAIARTLAMDTDIILFDEPTSALDPTMVNEVLIVIGQLAKKGKTMLIVTHEMNFAKNVSNRIFYMDEGGIYEDGSPEQIFENPQKVKTRRFISHVNVLDIDIHSEAYDYPGTVSNIYKYGFKYGIPSEKCEKLIAAFEELCQNIIIEELKSRNLKVDIKISVENSADSGEINMNVRYNGNINPENCENSVAYKLLKYYAKAVNYKHIPQSSDDYTDEVNITIN